MMWTLIKAFLALAGIFLLFYGLRHIGKGVKDIYKDDND